MSKEKFSKQPETTTIAITKKHASDLNKLRRGRDSYDDVLDRLIACQADVYVEFNLIDNEFAPLHTCVFQLGKDTDSLYHWDGIDIKSVDKKTVNILMKQPKPNLTMTREEVSDLYYDPIFHDPDQLVEQKKWFTLFKRMHDFLENKPNTRKNNNG